MVTFLLLLTLAAAAPKIPHESELKSTVSAYWDLMAKGEKAAALKFVLPSCQNDFVNRVEPKIRTWSLISVEPAGEKEVVVTVQLEALFKETALTGGFQKVQKRETWVRDKNSWKLKVAKPSIDAIRPIFSNTAEPQLPNALYVNPTVIKIQFLNESQVGRIDIQNGMPQPAELVSIKLDETRFELLKRPSRIEPGKTAELTLRYKGDENDKNLQSHLTLVLKQQDQEKVFQVPILYNYLSDGARGLFGLTEEQARNLKRGDKVRPVVKAPEKGARQVPNAPVPPAKQP